jgi:hypothetical protein
MMQPRPIRGEPVTGKRVVKPVKLPDGRVIEFPVFEADPPEDRFLPNKVQLMSVDEFGRARRRRTG